MRSLTAALSAVVAGALPVFLTASAAGQIARSFPFSSTMLGLAVAVFHLVGVIISPAVARVLDRAGVRLALRTSAVTAALASVCIVLFARSGLELIGLLSAAGMSNATAGPAASALLRGTIPARHHGLAFGVQQAGAPTALLLAGIALPLVAVPFGWRWAFAGIAPIALFAGLAAPHMAPDQAPRTAGARSRIELGDARALLLLLLLATATASGVGVATISFLVVYATHSGMTPSSAGFLLGGVSLAALAGRIAFGLRADRRQQDPLHAVARLFLACTVSVALLASGAAVAIIAGALIMGGFGWAWQGTLTFALVRQNEEAPIQAVGWFMSAVFTGAMVGPALVGALASRASFPAAWWCCAALSLIPLRALALARRRARSIARRRAYGNYRAPAARDRGIAEGARYKRQSPSAALGRMRPRYWRAPGAPRCATRLGWLAFLGGSIVFLIDGIGRRDVVLAVGSALFALGAAAFLVAEALPHPPLSAPAASAADAAPQHSVPGRALPGDAALSHSPARSGFAGEPMERSRRALPRASPRIARSKDTEALDRPSAKVRP